jgi:hypothetical protein
MHNTFLSNRLVLLLCLGLLSSACNDFFTKDIVFAGGKSSSSSSSDGTEDGDDDGDGLSNAVEASFSMDERSSDSDGDGMGDGLEFVGTGGDPLNSNVLPRSMSRARTVAQPLEDTSDSDGDGLGDINEENNSLNPELTDSVEDGYADGLELVSQRDPLSASSRPGRGVPPQVGGDTLIGGADGDEDGISDEREAQLGLDPDAADSDGDGFGDGLEYLMGSQGQNARSIPAFEGN